MTTDPQDQPIEEPEASGLSRRKMIGGAAVGAGALWIAPNVVGLSTPAAAVSTVAVPTIVTRQSSGDGGTLNFGTIGPGFVVAVMAARTSFFAGRALTLVGGSVPTLWNETSAAAGLLRVKAWAGYLSSPTAMSATWSSNEAAALVALYPTGTTREPAGLVTPGTTTVSSTLGPTNNVTVGGAGRRMVFLSGYTDTATFTPPSGYANATTFGNSSVTVAFADSQYNGAAGVYAGQTGTLSTGRGSVSGLVAVV